MRVEQHLLALARIRPDIDRPRCTQSHMRDLHPHRLARDLHILMAPVELVGLAGLEHQRDEGRDTIAGILATIGLPARRVAPPGTVGALKLGRASGRERVCTYV